MFVTYPLILYKHLTFALCATKHFTANCFPYMHYAHTAITIAQPSSFSLADSLPGWQAPSRSGCHRHAHTLSFTHEALMTVASSASHNYECIYVYAHSQILVHTTANAHHITVTPHITTIHAILCAYYIHEGLCGVAWWLLRIQAICSLCLWTWKSWTVLEIIYIMWCRDILSGIVAIFRI